MAMFRHKQNAALNFSKTLTDHFNVSNKGIAIFIIWVLFMCQKVLVPFVFQTSAQASHNPLSNMSSPASTSASSGPGSNQSTNSQEVTIPQEVKQMVFSYVNITALFLSAHELWEQAEEVAHRGSGKNEKEKFLFLHLSTVISIFVKYNLDSFFICWRWEVRLCL